MLNILNLKDSPEILTAPSVDVEQHEILSPEFQKLLDDMMATAMNLNALGLAASQIGVNKRVFIARAEDMSDNFVVFINPEFVMKKDRVKHYGEACLSLPEKGFKVNRFKNVVIKAQDRTGVLFTIKSKTKIQAFIFQHEMDHLNGMLLNSRGVEI
jgi:peptide deformylase